MKHISRFIFIVSIFLIYFNAQTTFSQSMTIKPSSKSYAMFNRVIVESGVLEDGNYTYEFKDKKVLVEIKDGYYYEYHSNREFIIAKIEWSTAINYKLTIVSLQKRGTPLKIGSILTSRIDKIEGNQYFYTSILNQKTLKGSFQKVN